MDIKSRSSKKGDNNLSLDKNSISSIKSSKRSKTVASQPAVHDAQSIDISMTQLEMLANKQKLNKKSPEVSVADLLSEKVTEQVGDTSNRKEVVTKKTTIAKKSSSEMNLRTTTDDSSYEKHKQRKREKVASRENRNEEIRRQKSEYLYKFNKLNAKGKWSSLRLDMECTLDEIRNEVERVQNEIQTERSVAFFKRMLLMGVQGVEWLNNRFDPLGVDLDGWSEAIGYSLDTDQEYDEVLAELYEKYKGRGKMSPEMKLMFMLVGSATMFTISKKITSMDNTNAIKSMLGGLMSAQGNAQMNAHMQQQSMQQQMPSGWGGAHIPSPQELQRQESDTTEDRMPSRLNGPPDTHSVELNNIMKTMNERKREKEAIQDINKSDSDEVFKSIAMTVPKRKRGRPRKNTLPTVSLSRLNAP